MRLKDKVAIITGSSRGIGKAIALSFAKEGAKVVINYNTSKLHAENVVDEIKKLGFEAIATKADVSNEDEVKALVDTTIRQFGKIDILVNNAGIVFDIPFREKTVEQWQKTLATNLIGVFLCSKYASEYMPEGSRIINISSTNGIYSMHPESMDYDASKAGVIAMTKSLAQELSPNVLVNSIAPGWVATDMNKELPEDFIKREVSRIWVKRFGKPEEIANVAVFLASNESSYISGATLIVDGGYSS